MRRDLSSGEVGIIGGGQLARMLAQSALRLGLKPVIYAESAQCPAADSAHDVMVGALRGQAQLTRFLKRVEVVVFENEFVDVELLERAAARARKNPRALFRPGLATIATLQDKLTQKKLLVRLKIPTAPFLEIRKFRDIETATERFGAAVLKWSRLGYDGKGVLILDPKKRIELRVIQAFYETAAQRGIPVYAEKKIDFRRELALIGVASGVSRAPQFASYPLVISEQEDGICKLVTGPATTLGVPFGRESDASRIARKIADATGLAGAFGVEFFETRSGAILVNEIAPRVHNSGHYTQNAFSADQFENHWRGALGLPLRDPRLEPFQKNRRFAMLNLLGPPEVALSEPRHGALPLPEPGPSTHLHWYGKTEIRARRKLGHLNGVADSNRALERLLREFRASERSWIQRLRRVSK
jgi:5-(carboxyamino)imidazole ribonucleotide synthase